VKIAMVGVSLVVANLCMLPPVLANEEERADLSTLEPNVELHRKFDGWLEDPGAYRVKVLAECEQFPEGRIYPFLIPAVAYCNLAVRGEVAKAEASMRMRVLIDLALPLIAEFVSAPEGDLLSMPDYQQHGTFLTTLNYALSAYALISNDRRYAKLHDHLTTLLMRAIDEAQGAEICSYPAYTWYFDTIMANASIQLRRDSERFGNIESYYRRHLAWRKDHVLNSSGVPIAFAGTTARGCDVSMQICLLASFDNIEAKRLYDCYVRSHWIDLGIGCGFSEWPKGHEDVAEDIDSGPLVLGIGTTASAVGVGATKAVGDLEKWARLVQEAKLVSSMIRTTMKLGMDVNSAWTASIAPIDSNYFTGFLYGDCIMFYALTWQDLGAARRSP
jgi:hypothetical protein